MNKKSITTNSPEVKATLTHVLKDGKMVRIKDVDVKLAKLVEKQLKLNKKNK